MNPAALTRALNSIGKKCFVDYFNDFKRCTDKSKLAQKLLADNPRAYSLNAQITRINYAKWIFENGLEYEALKIITNARIHENTIAKASKLILE